MTLASANHVIRRFYQTLGVLLVLLGIVSVFLPILPGALMILVGVGIISPKYRERLLAAGRRILDRLPAVHRFHRRQAIRLVLLALAAVLVGAAVAAAFLLQN